MSSFYSKEYLHTIEAEGHHTKPIITANGTTAELEQGKHHPLVLSSIVVDRLRASTLTSYPDVAKGLSAWKRMAQKLHDPRNKFTLPTRNDMQKIVHIFSQIFFFNKLKRTRFEWSENLYHLQSAFGQAYRAEDEETYLYKITIDPKDLHLESGTIDHFTCMMSTLLHECVHAFLGIYSCSDDHDCPDPRCTQTKARVVGLTHHGMAWLQMASHVQAYAREELFEHLDVDIESAWMEEDQVQGSVLALADLAYFPRGDVRDELEEYILEAMPKMEWPDETQERWALGLFWLVSLAIVLSDRVSSR